MVGSVIDLCSEKFCIASCSFSFERENLFLSLDFKVSYRLIKHLLDCVQTALYLVNNSSGGIISTSVLFVIRNFPFSKLLSSCLDMSFLLSLSLSVSFYVEFFI